MAARLNIHHLSRGNTMRKIRFALLMAAVGISGIASAQVYSAPNTTVTTTTTYIVDEIPDSKITAELTDRDCPAGTKLIFDENDMNRAKCVWSWEAQRNMRNY